MAKMGLVDDSQFNKEIENVSKNNPLPIKGEVITESPKGRGVGNVQVPDELRKLIGEESIIHGRQAAIDFAADFGISPSSVSAYAKGATSTTTYNKPSDSLTKYLESRKQRLTKKSLRVLHSALDSITPDKLKDIKARDASAIAKDMSVIAKNMTPDSANAEQNAKPQFVVYAPTMRDERTYETIVVNDNF